MTEQAKNTAQKAAETLTDDDIITELVERVPASLVIALLIGGAIIGAGIVVFLAMSAKPDSEVTEVKEQ